MNAARHDCKDELNQARLRATPTRLAVIGLFETTTKPLDIHAIFDALKEKNVKADFATVYRIINAFTEKRLIKKISFHEGKFRYELARKPEHHHLICTSCGRIEDFPECIIEGLETSVSKKSGFTIDSHTLEFFGICRHCRKKNN